MTILDQWMVFGSVGIAIFAAGLIGSWLERRLAQKGAVLTAEDLNKVQTLEKIQLQLEFELEKDSRSRSASMTASAGR